MYICISYTYTIQLVMTMMTMMTMMKIMMRRRTTIIILLFLYASLTIITYYILWKQGPVLKVAFNELKAAKPWSLMVKKHCLKLQEGEMDDQAKTMEMDMAILLLEINSHSTKLGTTPVLHWGVTLP